MNEKVADKIIRMLSDAGMTPDQMLETIKMARVKYEKMKAGKSH